MNATVEVTTDPRQVAMDVTRGYRVPFTEHEAALRSQVNEQPSLQELCAYVVKYGADGILESALHLNDEDFMILAKACARAPKPKRSGRRSS